MTLSEWFGCDEWLRDPVRPWHIFKSPPNVHEKKIYRMLIIDGLTEHSRLDFIEYCIMFDIIIVIFPPHSTHILQPLDVGVFQPKKEAYQKAIRSSLLEGNLAFSRIAFITAFKEVFEEGFTKHNIPTGFTKSGMYPANAEPAITQILQ